MGSHSRPMSQSSPTQGVRKQRCLYPNSSQSSLLTCCGVCKVAAKQGQGKALWQRDASVGSRETGQWVLQVVGVRGVGRALKSSAPAISPVALCPIWPTPFLQPVFLPTARVTFLKWKSDPFTFLYLRWSTNPLARLTGSWVIQLSRLVAHTCPLALQVSNWMHLWPPFTPCPPARQCSLLHWPVWHSPRQLVIVCPPCLVSGLLQLLWAPPGPGRPMWLLYAQPQVPGVLQALKCYCRMDTWI